MQLNLTRWFALAIFLSCAGWVLAQQPAATGTKKLASAPPKHKLGPLDFSVNWRARAEGWDWFKGPAGHGNYTFGGSQLRIGIGQQGERFDWFLEGAQVGLVGLPSKAVVAAPQGQLGLGGTYYAANGNNANNVGGFLKQGYVQFKDLAHSSVKVGRFEYFDGLEVKPKDPTLAALIQTRISSRLISNFAFSTAQRSFDGVQTSTTLGHSNLSLAAMRPTEGVFQVDGMGEMDIDTYYGALTVPVETPRGVGEFRLFGLGYIDHRTHILKTDNRSATARAADHGKIEIATYGANYVHVFNTTRAGKFDILGWGAIQGGAWGTLQQHAGAAVFEMGWQAPTQILKPWLSAGYSYGSGDGNPTDSRHGTFFQVLPTPRYHARFPFYNMMNNEDFYGTLNLRPVSRVALRSELHTLRLANASDLWYLGGGAYQRNTFGYTGRPSNGRRGLANVWDLSADYQITRMLSTTLYYGHAWGKSVVAKIYPRDPNGQLLYLETNFRF